MQHSFSDAIPVISIRNPHGNMKPISRDMNLHPVDDMVRRLNRLCWIANQPKTTGRLIQLGIQIGGSGMGDNTFIKWQPMLPLRQSSSVPKEKYPIA
jgi:hypothetical protein